MVRKQAAIVIVINIGVGIILIQCFVRGDTAGKWAGGRKVRFIHAHIIVTSRQIREEVETVSGRLGLGQQRVIAAIGGSTIRVIEAQRHARNGNFAPTTHRVVIRVKPNLIAKAMHRGFSHKAEVIGVVVVARGPNGEINQRIAAGRCAV